MDELPPEGNLDSVDPRVRNEPEHSAFGSLRGTRKCEVLPSPEDVPLYDLVTVRGPEGEILEGYRGVRRRDSGSVVSVVSSRYGLVQHQDVARAVHSVGVTLGSGDGMMGSPFNGETIRLYSGGRRMEHKLVVARKFAIRPGEEFYPGIRVYNSLDGSWAVRVEGFALRVSC